MIIMMIRPVLLLIPILMVMEASSWRLKRDLMEGEGRNHSGNCVGHLKFQTKKETLRFSKSSSKTKVKNIEKLTLEGTCCVIIYSRKNFRGKSHSINKPGDTFPRLKKVHSVKLKNC